MCVSASVEQGLLLCVYLCPTGRAKAPLGPSGGLSTERERSILECRAPGPDWSGLLATVRGPLASASSRLRGSFSRHSTLRLDSQDSLSNEKNDFSGTYNHAETPERGA